MLERCLNHDDFTHSRRCVLASAVVACALAIPAVASAEVVKHIDLRRDLAEERAYYVVFCARSSLNLGTGHAFVVWIEHDGHGEDVQSQAFGYYPQADGFGIGKLVGKGFLADESTRPASIQRELLTHRIVVRVNREEYLSSHAPKQKWREGTFRIIRKNCTHFVREVALQIGLRPPEPRLAERPAAYYNRLAVALQRDQTRLAAERQTSSRR